MPSRKTTSKPQGVESMPSSRLRLDRMAFLCLYNFTEEDYSSTGILWEELEAICNRVVPQ